MATKLAKVVKYETVKQPVGRPFLGEAAFIGLAGDIVDHAYTHSEADSGGLMGHLLTGMSGIVGPNVRVKVGTGSHPVFVWTGLIGDSNDGRKGEVSSAIDPFLEFADKNFMDNNRMGKLSSGEGMIARIRDEVFKTDKEGVETLKCGTKDKRLFVEAGELVNIMINSAMGNLGGDLCDTWDGKNLYNPTREDPMVVTKPGVVISGHIPPLRFIKQAGMAWITSGTGNRFLYFFVNGSKLVPIAKTTPEWYAERERLGNLLGERLAKVRKLGECTIDLDEEASAYYETHLYKKLRTVPKGMPTLASELLTRRAPHCLRVAAVYAIINGHKDITLEDLKAAEDVVDFSTATIAYLVSKYRAFTSSGELMGLKVLDALNEAGKVGLTRTHIGTNLLHTRVKPKDLDDLLEELGAVRVKRMGAGTKAVEYVYGPDFAPRIPAQR
jgi:hypothetical protein